ncbi:MAG: TRAP transporter large permease [Rhodospirillales bacterium]|nr:TRAP transporter large permease [Rhodospirillales bacterium]
MSGTETAILLFAALFVLVGLRIAIGVALLFCGVAGYVLLSGWIPLISYLKTGVYLHFSNYSLSVIPLFLLMGQFAMQAGMSQALFGAATAWFGHRRGGVALAAIVGAAAFGAICGSSVATTATMGQVALPEMRRLGYSSSLATGTLAVGGSLGMLIPPSVILVVYGILTEQNIAKLFMAAFIPGLLAALGYMIAISIYCRVNPKAGPAEERVGWRERVLALRDVWPVIVIFTVVVLGTNVGWFTPTEGAAVGAFSTFLLCVLRRRMSWPALRASLLAVAEVTAMIFLILLGAEVFNAVLALSQMPMKLASAIGESGLPPYGILIAILVVYIGLGCVMDELAMLLLTLPIFFPIVMGLDFGMPPDEKAIWFGILVLVIVGIGLVAPPVGMNVFVINALAKDVPIVETYRGVLPFILADIVRAGVLVAFPVLSLWLVRLFP